MFVWNTFAKSILLLQYTTNHLSYSFMKTFQLFSSTGGKINVCKKKRCINVVNHASLAVNCNLCPINYIFISSWYITIQIIRKCKLNGINKFSVSYTTIWHCFFAKNSLTEQSCNEESSKILGEGRWYWIHDFVATFRVNNRPIYMALWS